MASQTNKDFWSGVAKILEEQWEIDIRLKAGDSIEGSSISAHKLILASKSEIFKKMLESDEVKTTTTGKVETVTLSEMKHEELEALIEFIYSDGSCLSDKAMKHVRSLYLAADKYMILHLRNLCRNKLISSLNSENAIDVLELSQTPFDKVLYDAAFNTITTNIITIIDSDKFKDFVIKHTNLAVETMKASLTRSRNKKSCGYCGNYCRRCNPY